MLAARSPLSLVHQYELLAEALEDDVYLVDAVLRVHLLPFRVELPPGHRAYLEVVHAHAFRLRGFRDRVGDVLSVVDVYLQDHAPPCEQRCVNFQSLNSVAETLVVVVRQSLDQRQIAENVFPADLHEYVLDVLLRRHVDVLLRLNYVLKAVSAKLDVDADLVALVSPELVLFDVAVVVGLALLRGPPIHLLRDVAPAPRVVLSIPLEKDESPYFLLGPLRRH